MVFRFNLYTSNHRARRGGERDDPVRAEKRNSASAMQRRHETAINLSAELGVSERTIRADLVILSCYYPIQVVRGRFGGGIHLPDWFHMESRTLSSKQQVLLMKVRKTLSGDDLQVMNSILAQFALYWEYR